MLILTKIQQAKYIKDMYNQEYLYFKSLKDFRSSQKDVTGRKDPKELNLSNKQLKKLTIKIDDTKIIHLHDLKGFSGQFTEFLGDSKINCCSLHWLKIVPNQAPSTFNEKLLNLGDKSLLIYNWRKFFEIFDNSIRQMGLEFSRKKVKYYDPKVFNGNISLHHKDKEYSWQNEYRILIAPTNNEPIFVSIPGLKKISCVIDTKDLINLRIKINN
jgi:hypothetical protein